MSEFDQPRGRRERDRVRGVQAVLRGLVLHHTTEPFPAMSDHYRPEEPVADVVQLRFDGWDDMGNYFNPHSEHPDMPLDAA